MIAPDNKASFLLRNRSALFRNISKAHHTSPHKSVPLRGLWFLSSCPLRRASPPFGNPSPCGDCGSYPKVGTISIWVEFGEFPSPCGDCGSYRLWRRCEALKVKRVSVPLRGLWFLSLGDVKKTPQRRTRVSVPLRGLWFLSEQEESYTSKASFISVPLRGLWFLSSRPTCQKNCPNS